MENEDVKALLKLNECNDKTKVARQKIIKCHFSGTFDVSALSGSNNQMLPDALSWFGKDALGYAALYTMLRSKPDVIQSTNNTASSSI